MHNNMNVKLCVYRTLCVHINSINYSQATWVTTVLYAYLPSSHTHTHVVPGYKRRYRTSRDSLLTRQMHLFRDDHLRVRHLKRTIHPPLYIFRWTHMYLLLCIYCWPHTLLQAADLIRCTAASVTYKPCYQHTMYTCQQATKQLSRPVFFPEVPYRRKKTRKSDFRGILSQESTKFSTDLGTTSKFWT
jgi:hypothetical protein